MVTFEYQFLIDNGFKRIPGGEDIKFFEKYGYEYFIVEKQIQSHALLEWDIHTHQITLLGVDKDKVSTKHKVETFREFEFLMKMCDPD